MAKTRGDRNKKTARKVSSKKKNTTTIARKSSSKKVTASQKKKAPSKKTAKKASSKKTAKKAPSKKTAKKAPSKKTAKKASSKKTAKKASSKKTAKPKRSAKSNRSTGRPGRKKRLTLPQGFAAHPDAGLSARQVQFLYGRLVEERARKKSELERHMQEALGEAGVMPDETDMAQRHTEQAYLIRFADKERKLLNEIERSLAKLRTADYGVCEGTEEPIGFKRLELRPWTRYSVAYKEQIERERSQHRR